MFSKYYYTIVAGVPERKDNNETMKYKQTERGNVASRQN